MRIIISSLFMLSVIFSMGQTTAQPDVKKLQEQVDSLQRQVNYMLQGCIHLVNGCIETDRRLDSLQTAHRNLYEAVFGNNGWLEMMNEWRNFNIGDIQGLHKDLSSMAMRNFILTQRVDSLIKDFRGFKYPSIDWILCDSAENRQGILLIPQSSRKPDFPQPYLPSESTKP